MASNKTEVIEILFRDKTRWKGRTLIRSVVTLAEVLEAILVWNNTNPNAKTKLSTKNPANFFKDFVRKSKSAEENWPATVLKARYGGVQRTGAGNSFEFIPLPTGQTTAFAATAATYPKSPSNTKLSVVQTLSLDFMNKALARKDENWLQSIAVSLHIPQFHLALHPTHALPFTQVGHMQSNLKLRKTEIDGLYYGYLEGRRIVLITMEAKGHSDDILESQVLDQVTAVQGMKKVKELLHNMGAKEKDTIILPMSMKLVDASCASKVPGVKEFGVAGKKLLYMADYGTVPFNSLCPASLVPSGETLFDLRPPIAGLNQ